tara:strand:- start:1447 stop:2391 length:945 start_codon:yes stop_codon:yes gene_type:complete
MIKQVSKDYNLYYPKNDIEAYQKYTNYNFIYNKLNLFTYQKIKAFPLPIKPIKFPVVIKPIINLKGMGLDSFLINNTEDFFNIIQKKKLSSGLFWCKFLTGKHFSWDLIINNGDIVYYTVFQGVKNNNKKLIKKYFGTFKFWRQIFNKNLLIIIKKLVKDKFSNFTGHLNIETIGKYIIECHLRFGDIDFCNNDIILLALLNLNKKYILKQLNIVLNKKYEPLYLVPVWMEHSEIYSNILYQKIYNFIETKIEQNIIEDDKITGYYFDDLNHPSPLNFKRWLLLIGYDFSYLIKLSKNYTQQIKNELYSSSYKN